MVRVKICGITNVDDAQAALESGADYLGFIFYPPSPRAVTVERVKEIRQSLDDALSHFGVSAVDYRPQLVGVFVDESPEYIAAVLNDCSLDLAQLSGNEEPDAFVAPTSPLSGRFYKAIRPRSVDEAHQMAARFAGTRAPSDAPMPDLLIDTPHGKLYGGTGRTGDWAMSAELAREVPRLMLAGGLTPDNVADAVRAVRPFAVDVAGGVESSPGRKNPDLVRAFIARAKTAS